MRNRILGIATLPLFLAAAFAQTFTVLDQTTDIEAFAYLDTSTELRFSVSLAAPIPLTHILPTLQVPACPDGAGLPQFNATFLGLAGQSNPTNLAIPSWTNGQAKDLVFAVHLYDQQGGNGSPYCQGLLCADLDFALGFTFTGRTDPVWAQDPTQALSFQQPRDGYFIEDRHSLTPEGPPACQSYSQTLFHIALHGQPYNPALLADPAIRVLLGANWNLHIAGTGLPFSNGLASFLYPLGGSHIFDLVNQVSTQGLAMVDAGSLIRDEQGNPLILGPLGGTGPAGLHCDFQSWNFFEITNRTVPGGQVKDVLAALPANSNIQGGVGVTLVNFRQAGLFLARMGRCAPSSAFGISPPDFQITGLDLLPEARARVSLQVPPAWAVAAGGRLNGAYRIQWFYRNHNTYRQASQPGGSPTDPRNLTATLALPYALPSDYAVEARIEHLPTGSVVSVVSPRHGFGYTGLDGGDFDQAEDPPDAYLDPGEAFRVPATLQNRMGHSVQNLTIRLGVTGPNGTEMGFSSETATATTYGDASGLVYHRPFLADGQRVELDLVYRLLCMVQPCQDLFPFMEIAFRDGAFHTSYRQAFSLPAHCELEDETTAMDGSWTALDCFGSPAPCRNSNCTEMDCSQQTPLGWNYSSGAWTGATETTSFFYTLQSPSLPAGMNPSIHMHHEAAFDFRKAGGIVEYRTSPNGFDWTPWADLILPVEAVAGMLYYHPSPFSTLDIPPEVDNLIGGRRAFMAMAAAQNWTHPLPQGLINQDKVQFRFTFQQPQQDGLSAGSWTVSEFAYLAQVEAPDNLFLLPNQPVFPPCLAAIRLVPKRPGAYRYEWFVSLADLAAEDPDQVSLDGTWPGFPIPPEDAAYYVRITDTATDTARIGKFTVRAEALVPPLDLVVAYWQAETFPDPADINHDGRVDLIDLALQINLDECRD